jgi:hypothetical protein
MTHPTPTHPTPTRPGLAAAATQLARGNEEMPRPGPKPGSPKATLSQRCTDSAPHGPHPVRPRRLTWTPFQCAGRPSAAEQARELDEAFGPLTP